MRALVIADSPSFDSEYIARNAGAFDLVIVLDGAVHKLSATTIPHIVCGDFDSLDLKVAEAQYPQAEFIPLGDQNQNDLEKGVLLALSRGASEVVMVSAFGGRIDISLANLSVMIRHHTQCALSMVHGDMISHVLSDRTEGATRLSFMACAGSAISCIPLDGDATVSISNVRWALRQEDLRSGSHGVSNEASGGVVEVCVHRGMVVVVHVV